MFVNQWQASLKGTAARHVNIGALKKMLIPIAPFAEQKRIMAKVDELFAVCDQLVGQVTAAEASREQLLTAILAQAG
jgi:type I restriction enzyme S subunit